MAHFDDNDDWNEFGENNDHDIDSHRKLPVFIKAKEIADITRTICELIDEKKDDLQLRESMPGNAYILAAKIAGAEGGDLYSIRFDNATIISRPLKTPFQSQMTFS